MLTFAAHLIIFHRELPLQNIRFAILPLHSQSHPHFAGYTAYTLRYRLVPPLRQHFQIDRTYLLARSLTSKSPLSLSRLLINIFVCTVTNARVRLCAYHRTCVSFLQCKHAQK